MATDVNVKVESTNFLEKTSLSKSEIIYLACSRRFPILKWIRTYSIKQLRGDLIAAISISFTLIPQALAYGQLAGLPSQYGLYSAFIGAFVYCFLGTCRSITVGPTALMAIITARYTSIGGVAYTVILSLIIGVIQLFCGLVNAGFVVDFIGFPVISAFTTVAALTIAASQLQSLLGLTGYKNTNLAQNVINCFKHITELKFFDALMGTICVATLILLHFCQARLKKKRSLRKQLNSEMQSSKHKCQTSLLSTLHLFLLSKNAIIAIICAIIGWITINQDLITLIDPIPRGLPPLLLPNFTYTSSNSTENWPGQQVFQDMVPGVLIAALLGVLELVAIGKALKNSEMDASQEMIAIGVGNILGSFVGAFPVTGSFSRSAIANNSGVKTPANELFVGLIALGGITLLAPYFEFIPKTTLAASIIASVIFMAKPGDICTIWKTSRSDLLVYLVTIIGSIALTLEYGILLGVATSILIFIIKTARPDVEIELRKTPNATDYIFIQPNQSIIFASSEFFLDQILSSVLTGTKWVLLDGQKLVQTDSTFSLTMKSLKESLDKKGVNLIFYDFSDSICNSISGSGIEVLNYDNFDDCLTKIENDSPKEEIIENCDL